MDINKIFDLFEKIGCLTFSTVNKAYPESRIAHFFTCDQEGLYFLTMNTKPFYRQLKENGKLSVCGLFANSAVDWAKADTPEFKPGYFIRASGEVREFSIAEAKAKNDHKFAYLIEDNRKYPQITGFCFHKFYGEVYDYDFEKELRNHKLLRERFSFGGMDFLKAGLNIDVSMCIGCGRCQKACSFDAIYAKDDLYQINGSRCDECGNCFSVCPVGAVNHKGI